MKTFWKIIFGIALVLLAIWFIFGVTLSMISESNCKRECLSRGTFAYKMYSNGALNYQDLCVCFFDNNKMESFING